MLFCQPTAIFTTQTHYIESFVLLRLICDVFTTGDYFSKVSLYSEFI
jgi:hypothetical protein